MNNVNHPAHYNSGKIEVIDYIEDQQLDFCLGNVIKYVSRAGKKDPQKKREDLEKALWYLERELGVNKNSKAKEALLNRVDLIRTASDDDIACKFCYVDQFGIWHSILSGKEFATKEEAYKDNIIWLYAEV